MKLSEYLGQKSQSIGEFAVSIGVSHEAVRRYLRGERRPAWDVIMRISAATEGEVTADDFAEIENQGGQPEADPAGGNEQEAKPKVA